MRAWALLVAVFLVLGGCTREEPPAPPAPTPAGPPPAGTIRLGYGVEPPTLDPIAPGGGSAATRDVLRPIFPSLFRIGPDLRPEPELAAGFPAPEEITFDPFTVTLRLREARWSDGQPITAADVRFSWEQLRDGPTGARYDPLTDVEVGEDPRALRLHFDRVVRRWWALFGVDDMVLPAHAYAPGWAAPTVSGGPFRFAGAIEGLSLRLERNEAYWGELAGAEAIEVVFVPEDERRLELLALGELDAVHAAGESNVGYRAGLRGFSVVEGPLERGGASGGWGPSWWELDLDPERIGEPALRRALVSALDRSLAAEILEDSGQVMDGIPHRFPVRAPIEHGRPAIGGPWPQGRDLDRARDLLSGAGYRLRERTLLTPGGDPVEFTLAYLEGSSAASTIARFVHFALRDLGIRTELVGVDGDRFEQEWIGEARADMYLVHRIGADAPDPTVYLPDASPAGRTPDTTDAILLSRSASSRRDLRRRPATGLAEGAWTQVQRRLFEEATVVPLTRTRTWIVATSPVSGPHAVGSAAGPLWNAGDWRVEGS